MSPELDELVRQTADDHQWTGGYYCTCGQLLNSPAGFSLHALTQLAERL